MKTFTQWLAERGISLGEQGKRTALSPNYPSLYHSIRQQTPNAWTAIKADVPVQIKNGLGKEKPCSEFNPDSEHECSKETKKGSPTVTDRSENPYKSFYQS